MKDAALSGQHSILLLEDGTLRCTGYNGAGECKPPAGLIGVVQVVAGNHFSAVREATGKITVWGRGPDPPSGLKARWLATDGARLGAILEDGDLWFTGTGVFRTGGAKLAKLLMSDGHSWTLSEDGILSEVQFEAKKLEEVIHDVVDFLPTGFKEQPVLALTKTGTLWLNPLYGIPEFGQGRINFISGTADGCRIGFASGKVLRWRPGSSEPPQFVTGVNPASVKFVRSGKGQCMYALRNGRVLVSGYDTAGSLLLGPPSKPKRISSYDWSYFVLREDGAVATFGESVIDDGNETGPYFPVWRGAIGDVTMFAGSYFVAPDTLETFGIIDEGLMDHPKGLRRVEQVEWGINWALARTAEGKLATWGNRARDFKLPATKRKCIAVAAGHYHGVSLYDDGRVEEWGDLPRSQSPEIKDRPRPVLPEKITAVAAGQAHTLALSADGRVFAWGVDAGGLCEVPEDLKGVVAISASADHCAALLHDGRLRVWGNHAEPAANTPLLASIHAGRDCTAGITRDGKVVLIPAATGMATIVPLYGVFDRP